MNTRSNGSELKPISDALVIDVDDDPRLLTVDDVAGILRLEKGKKGRAWIAHAVNRGVKAQNGAVIKLVPFKLGRRNRFETSAVRDFIAALREASH